MKKKGYFNRYVILAVAAVSPDAMATTGLAGMGDAFIELLTIVFAIAGIVAATISWRGNRSERTNDFHHSLSIILIVIAIVSWLSSSELNSFVTTSIAIAYLLSLLLGRSVLQWKERKIRSGAIVTVGFALLILLNPKVIDFNKYVFVDNDPLDDSVLVVNLAPSPENIPPSENFIEIEGGTILYSPGFRKDRVGFSVGSRIMLSRGQLEGKLYLHYAQLVERRRPSRSLYHIPLFNKPVDGYRKSSFGRVSIVQQNGETVWGTLSEALSDQVKMRDLNMALITWLLQNGADANYSPDSGKSFTAFYAAVHRKDAKLVNLMLDHGADPNHGEDRNALTVTPGSARDVDFFRTLLNRGADPNFRTKWNMETPLHYYGGRTPSYEMVKLLLDHGADRSLKNKKGETPGDLAQTRINEKRQYQKSVGLDEDAINEKVKREQKVLELLM